MMPFNDPAGSVEAKICKRLAELPWGSQALQDGERHYPIFDDDRARGGLHPGIAVVNHADLRCLGFGEAQERQIGDGWAGLSLLREIQFLRNRQVLACRRRQEFARGRVFYRRDYGSASRSFGRAGASQSGRY